MNVNFSSLEYLWLSISTAGAIVVAIAYNRDKRKDNIIRTHTQCMYEDYIHFNFNINFNYTIFIQNHELNTAFERIKQ